jgi:hypothetical protein
MPRYTRHEEVPVFETRAAVLDANRFNRVTLTQKRSGESLRLDLPTLRHLDLILQADAWVVVDRGLNDIPLLAWTDFRVDADNRLHRPVHCRVRLFHAQAGLLLRRALADLERLLDERLDADGGERGQVVPFPDAG